MDLIDFDDCVSKGLLKRTTPSPEQAKAGLKKAKILLSEAKADLKDRRFNSSLMTAYAAILNAGRAVLFKDGFREKSHFCVARYLEAKHKDKLPKDCIMLLDHFRESRHDVQYESSYLADEGAARQIIEFADVFISSVEKLIS
jgi:uncharacterized protein (UPF0332 family)